MQRAVGLDARWVDVDEIRRLIPAMAGDGYRGTPTSRRTAGSIRRGTSVRTRSRCSAPRPRCAKGSGSSESDARWPPGASRGSRRSRRPPGRSRRPASCSPAARRSTAGRGGGRRARLGRATRPASGRLVDRTRSDALHADNDRDGVRHSTPGSTWRPGGGGFPFGDVEPGGVAADQGVRSTGPYLRLDAATPAPVCSGDARPRAQKAWAATIEYTPDHLHRPPRPRRRDRSRRRVDRVRVWPRHDGARVTSDRDSTLRSQARPRWSSSPPICGWIGSTPTGVSTLVDPIALPFPVTLERRPIVTRRRRCRQSHTSARPGPDPEPPVSARTKIAPDSSRRRTSPAAVRTASGPATDAIRGVRRATGLAGREARPAAWSRRTISPSLAHDRGAVRLGP